MSFPSLLRRITPGHLLLLALMIGAAAAYLLDARSVSLKANNLALVQPAAIAIFVLGAVILAGSLRAPERPAETRQWRDLLRVGLLAAAFGAFVFSLETIGFDGATFLFTACGLWLCGERRLWVVLAYALAFTLLVVLGYQQLVPYPFPMLVL